MSQEFVAAFMRETPVEEFTDTSLYHFVASAVTGPYQPYRVPVVPGSGTSGLYGTHFVSDREGTAVIGWRPASATLDLTGKARLRWNDAGEPRIDVPQEMQVRPRGPQGEALTGTVHVQASTCAVVPDGRVRCTPFAPPEVTRDQQFTDEPPAYIVKQFSRYRRKQTAVCHQFIAPGSTGTDAGRETITVQCVKRK